MKMDLTSTPVRKPRQRSAKSWSMVAANRALWSSVAGWESANAHAGWLSAQSGLCAALTGQQKTNITLFRAAVVKA